MATNIAAKPRYLPYLLAPTTALDQVDNSTNATLIFKSHHFVNRMNDKYHREDERLKTFENWPYMWLDKHQLAQTGMFFTNEDDKVKCYFCEVEIGRWEREDQPVPEHLRWSPNCPLLRRRTTNNVPLNSDALDRVLPPLSYDICGANDSALERHDHAYAEGRIPISHIIQSIGVNTGPNLLQTTSTATSTATQANGGDVVPEPCRPMAASGNYFPEYPEYAVETARLRSFEAWPRHMKQKPQQLAEAGFFYTGVGDRVRCFSCGGGLKDWDENDEPWEQHALWLNQCRFVKLMKGQLYIDTVAAKPTTGEHKAECPSTPPTETTTVSLSSQTSDAAPAGDVAPEASAPSVATRIYDKIVAIAKEDNNSSATNTEANGTCPSVASGSSIPEEKLCKICYASEYNTAFLPCGHVVACAKCASSVTKCPLCRKPFTDVMRVYFS